MSKQNILTRSKRKRADALLNEQRFEDARKLFQQICKSTPQDADAWFMLGITNAQLGDLNEAIKCNQRSITLRPDFPAAHFNLGVALNNLGRLEEAELCYRKAIQLNPDEPFVLNNLANLLQAQGNADEALQYYRRALEIKPDYINAYVNMGNVLHQTARSNEAETIYRKALSINPSHFKTLINLASVQISLGKYDEALQCCQRLKKLYPGQPDILVIEAKVFEKRGQPDQAYRIIEPLIEQGIEDIDIAILFGSLCRHTGSCDEAIAMLRRVLSTYTDKNDTGYCSTIHFKLGTLYDAAGDFDQAFKHFKAANELKNRTFNGESFSAYVDMLIDKFNPRFLADLPQVSNQSMRPLFIIGMPRSGTSLVEQILASHPQVFGAGELEDIRLIIAELTKTVDTQTPYPDCLLEVTQEKCDQLAEGYLAHLTELSDDARYVINKMPTNFLHLGIINMLFPNARVIHCTRNPLDTCLSCYFNEFIGTHAYAYRLEDLGIYYSNYHRLMQHWEHALNIPILDIANEELINDQEDITRRILDFCDLEWDDACLKFHENKRVVKTLSYNQVRQPINARSVGRWKHYDAYLEPLKIHLADDISW